MFPTFALPLSLLAEPRLPPFCVASLDSRIDSATSPANISSSSNSAAIGLKKMRDTFARTRHYHTTARNKTIAHSQIQAHIAPVPRVATPRGRGLATQSVSLSLEFKFRALEVLVSIEECWSPLQRVYKNKTEVDSWILLMTPRHTTSVKQSPTKYRPPQFWEPPSIVQCDVNNQQLKRNSQLSCHQSLLCTRPS